MLSKEALRHAAAIIMPIAYSYLLLRFSRRDTLRYFFFTPCVNAVRAITLRDAPVILLRYTVERSAITTQISMLTQLRRRARAARYEDARAVRER